MASKRWCEVYAPSSKTRGSLAMSSQVMTGSMMHPRGSAAICQCRGGSITGSWSIRKDQPRPAHEREGLNIHYGPSNKTSDSLPTLTRGVAVLMTHPQRPAAMCQWQVKDGAKVYAPSSKTRGSLAMSSRVMTGFMMHPRDPPQSANVVADPSRAHGASATTSRGRMEKRVWTYTVVPKRPVTACQL